MSAKRFVFETSLQSPDGTHRILSRKRVCESPEREVLRLLHASSLLIVIAAWVINHVHLIWLYSSASASVQQPSVFLVLLPKDPTMYLRPLFLTFLASLPVAFTSPTLSDELSSLETRAVCNLTALFASWEIYQEPDKQNLTDQTGPVCPPDAPNCSGEYLYYDFQVSQAARAKNQHDLVASFTHDTGELRCPNEPGGHGPYQLEFHYSPQEQYTSTGSNTNIDVFTINGDIPKQFDGHREYFYNPNWQNIGPLTGGLVGSFSLPEPGSKAAKKEQVISVGKVKCGEQINVRLSLSDASKAAGDISYRQFNQSGFRLRWGC